MIILGVDPGSSKSNPGGLVLLSTETEKLAGWRSMPVTDIGPGTVDGGVLKTRTDGQVLAEWLRDHTFGVPDRIRAFIEDPGQVGGPHSQPMAKQSVWGSVHTVEAVCDVLGIIDRYRVRPSEWRAPYGKGVAKSGENKAPNRRTALELFPELGKLKARETGIADAALIALWGARYYTG